MRPLLVTVATLFTIAMGYVAYAEHRGDWELAYKVDPITDRVTSMGEVKAINRSYESLQIACRSNEPTYLMLEGSGDWTVTLDNDQPIETIWRFDKEKPIIIYMVNTDTLGLGMSADKSKRYLQKMKDHEKLVIRTNSGNDYIFDLSGSASAIETVSARCRAAK